MANTGELSLQNLRIRDKAGSEQIDAPLLGSAASQSTTANHSPAAGSKETSGITVKPKNVKASATNSHVSGGQVKEVTNIGEPVDARNQGKSAVTAAEFNSREDIATKIAEAAFSYDEDFDTEGRHADIEYDHDLYAAQSRYVSSDAFAMQISEVTLPAKYINANNI